MLFKQPTKLPNIQSSQQQIHHHMLIGSTEEPTNLPQCRSSQQVVNR